LVTLGGNVKIVHLSTSHTGGAGIAARRLNNLLRSKSIDSYFVTLNKVFYKPDLGEIIINRSILRKFFGGVVSKFNKSLAQQTYFSLASISAISLRELKKFGDSKTTIFHIHNWFNLLSLRTIENLFKEGYHLVFTLHDQRLFTGGCHYSLQCEGYISNCHKCPFLKAPINLATRLNLRRLKKMIFRYQQQITIIAPSKWILNSAKSSNILGNSNIQQISNIHYGFNATSKPFSSLRIGIEKPIKFGIASMDKSSSIKGGDLVDQLMRVITTDNLEVRILALYDFFESKIDPLKFWGNIDYLLVLSRADNSPNVIHEAKINGIPVIGANVGGMSELLNPEYDFPIEMNGREVNQILKIIKEISTSKKKSDPKLIQKNYSEFISSELSKFLQVYESVSTTVNKNN
jgi:glycosyltransferase involved in cell wall biosynthesis